MSKINEALREHFRTRANHLEPVIVILRAGARLEPLQQAGMRIKTVMRKQPIVTGEVDAATLDKLSLLDEVVRVDPDGIMHAT